MSWKHFAAAELSMRKNGYQDLNANGGPRVKKILINGNKGAVMEITIKKMCMPVWKLENSLLLVNYNKP